MDKSTVWLASEQDLVKLGLTERGDIICIKSYCVPSNMEEQKDELLTVISNTGKERVNKKSRQSKAVSIGWMHFNCIKERYVRVNQNKGGGMRRFTFSSNTSEEHILSKAKETFFNKKKTSYGNEEDSKFFLGNFQGKVMDTKEFILQDYITSNKLTKTRLFLYVYSKPKSNLELINDMIQDDADFTDDLDYIFPSVSNIAFLSATSASLETNSNTINLHESSSAEGNLKNAGKVYDASNENEEHFEERRVLPTFENATSHSAFVPAPSSTFLSSVAMSNELQSFTEDLPC